MASAEPKKIMIVAGESSADSHAAQVVRRLTESKPSQYEFFGVGGTFLRSAGVDVTVDLGEINVVGLSDWLGKARKVFSAFRRTKESIKNKKPDLAILLDLPDFNLLLAKELKKQGVPILYYISPQVWAWRKYRIQKIRKLIDRMLVILPFEEEFYRKNGVSVKYVGNPLVESISDSIYIKRSPQEILAAPSIAILPGSRESEVKNHADLIRILREKIKQNFPKARFLVPVAKSLNESDLKGRLGSQFEYFSSTKEVMSCADVAVVASGTAVLETALYGVPCCLFYKLNGTTRFIVENIVRYRNFFGMPNLLLGEEKIAEYVFSKATAENLNNEVAKLIHNVRYREEQLRAFSYLRNILGKGCPADSVALEVERMLTRPGERKLKNEFSLA